MGFYVLSQVLVAIGIGFDLLANLTKTKKQMMLMMTLANVFFVLSYIFLFNTLAIISNVLYLVRCVVFMYYDAKAKPYRLYLTTTILLFAAYLPFWIIFYNLTWDVLLLVAVLLALVACSLKNMIAIRICLLINHVLWGTYNVAIGAYVNLLCDIIGAGLITFALIKYKTRNHVITPQPGTFD